MKTVTKLLKIDSLYNFDNVQKIRQNEKILIEINKQKD
jgi:hypothetical protein